MSGDAALTFLGSSNKSPKERTNQIDKQEHKMAKQH